MGIKKHKLYSQNTEQSVRS